MHTAKPVAYHENLWLLQHSMWIHDAPRSIAVPPAPDIRNENRQASRFQLDTATFTNHQHGDNSTEHSYSLTLQTEWENALLHTMFIIIEASARSFLV